MKIVLDGHFLSLFDPAILSSNRIKCGKKIKKWSERSVVALIVGVMSAKYSIVHCAHIMTCVLCVCVPYLESVDSLAVGIEIIHEMHGGTLLSENDLNSKNADAEDRKAQATSVTVERCLMFA